MKKVRWSLVAGVSASVMLIGGHALASDLDAKFLIKRAGKVIGTHHVDVTETTSGYLVETEIAMKVKFGPIPLFKYKHQASEQWVDDDLVSLESKTNNNGKKSAVRAFRTANGLMIEGSGYQGYAPENALPSSYWNKDLVETTAMINTQTGEIIELENEFLGRTPAPTGELAEHFRLTGTVALNLWYDGERWVGSNFTIDGEELTYEQVSNDQDADFKTASSD